MLVLDKPYVLRTSFPANCFIYRDRLPVAFSIVFYRYTEQHFSTPNVHQKPILFHLNRMFLAIQFVVEWCSISFHVPLPYSPLWNQIKWKESQGKTLWKKDNSGYRLYIFIHIISLLQRPIRSKCHYRKATSRFHCVLSSAYKVVRLNSLLIN